MKHIMPPHAKYVISSPTGAFADLDVSYDVASWDELDIQLVRDSTSGTFSEVSFPIKIALKGRELLKSLFEQDQLYAQAIFSIYVRDWDIAYKSLDEMYTLAKRMPLDFTTYSDDGNYVEISGVRAELIEYINSYGKNKYDIPVAEVCETTRWEYQRMRMFNQGEYSVILGLNTSFRTQSTSPVLKVPIYLAKAEMTPGTEHDMKDQQAGLDNGDYFFRAANAVRILLTMKFIIEAEVYFGDVNSIRLILYKRDAEGRLAELKNISLRNGLDEAINENMDLELATGDELTLVVRASVQSTGALTFIIKDTYTSGGATSNVENKFNITYYASGSVFSDGDAIPVIDPLKLMQRFLDEMEPGRFTCEIEWKDEPALIKFVTGESLRGYPLTGTGDKIAYLHGSPNDLIDFMRVMGYEFEVDDTVMRFKRRDEFFRRDLVAKTFTKKEVAEFKIVANSEFAYTKIVIGCEAQDYDSINGPFEPNSEHQYLTGFKNVDPAELDFISPYRTDPIGIELTTWERANLLTDKKADSDIFAVVLKRDGSRYVEYTDVYMRTTESPELKMFNALLNPYYLMKRNESLIGIISKEARFTSNEGSKSTRIVNGATTIDPRTDIPITRQLFAPIVYNFEAGFRENLPDISVRNGLVYVPVRDKIYKGYINNARKNPGHETASTWTLWAVMN